MGASMEKHAIIWSNAKGDRLLPRPCGAELCGRVCRQSATACAWDGLEWATAAATGSDVEIYSRGLVQDVAHVSAVPGSPTGARVESAWGREPVGSQRGANGRAQSR